VTVATGGRARRERSATESLLSITLALEAIVVFFVALTVYGLELLPAWIALGGGAALILLLVLDARLVRTPGGIWLGWALQLVLILLGLVTPVMWFVGAGFAALWVFCFVKGRQLDRAKAEYLAAHPFPEAADPSHPSIQTVHETKETE
jgi:Na+/melibiose symporter-like transporter